VAARLVRADNGFVIWSGTYDTQSDNVLKIQADVAARVTQALQSTLQRLLDEPEESAATGRMAR
jgi:TolB-like protein